MKYYTPILTVCDNTSDRITLEVKFYVHVLALNEHNTANKITVWVHKIHSAVYNGDNHWHIRNQAFSRPDIVSIGVHSSGRLQPYENLLCVYVWCNALMMHDTFCLNLVRQVFWRSCLERAMSQFMPRPILFVRRTYTYVFIHYCHWLNCYWLSIYTSYKPLYIIMSDLYHIYKVMKYVTYKSWGIVVSHGLSITKCWKKANYVDYIADHIVVTLITYASFLVEYYIMLFLQVHVGVLGLLNLCDMKVL